MGGVSPIDANRIIDIGTEQDHVVGDIAADTPFLIGEVIAGPSGEPSENLVGGACRNSMCRNTRVVPLENFEYVVPTAHMQGSKRRECDIT